MARCPNCGSQLSIDAQSCANCHAIFTGRAAWSPIPESPEEEHRKRWRPASVAPDDSSADGHIGGFYWIIAGAAYGVAMRALFGWLPHLFELMSMAFLLGTPFVVGALTVYAARNRKPSWGFMLLGPWLSVLLMLLGCGVTLLEGSVCLVLLAPLFLACASAGGLAMGFALALAGRHTSQLKAVAALPFLIAAGEARLPLQDRELEVRQSVHVNAAPHTVWQQILTAKGIRADELPISLTHFMGVPRPVEGVNVVSPEGEIRYSRWDRGVSFRGLVTRRREDESITWRYLFDAHSFPAGSMDEHVAIGGRYFDVHDTTFDLHPLPGGRTRLEVVAHYRVTSTINFYAVPAAELLGRDFVTMILGLYKGRSERAAKWQS